MIRPAEPGDLDALLAVYASARAYMCLHGNPSQWGDDYPSPALLEEDIRRGRLYVDTDERGTVPVSYTHLLGRLLSFVPQNRPAHAARPADRRRDPLPYRNRPSGLGRAGGVSNHVLRGEHPGGQHVGELHQHR